MITNQKLTQVSELLQRQFSGGAKHTELIPELVNLGWGHDDVVNLPEFITKSNLSNLKVLNYTWWNAPHVGREKNFIYAP